MSRRIEIELTSNRDDATFTWRAAGARQPKGDVAVTTLPEGARVGDTFRVEIETGLDGHEILGVIADRAPRTETDRLEFISRDIPDDELVTSRLATRSKGRGGPGRDRRDRGDRGRGDRARGDRRGNRRDGSTRDGHGPGTGPGDDGGRNRGERRGQRQDATDRPRGTRPERGTKPPKKRAPRAPRLRAGHTHRNAYIETLADEQRPVAEQLVRGGMPNLRQAIDQDNAKRRDQGQPEVPADKLIRIAESILPKLQVAEWHDRADAALTQIDDVDLRDLRSVVVAAADHAKSPETRTLADELATKLSERVDRAQTEWLTDLRKAVDEKRIARFLNLSSRPPKAGAPLPPDLVDSMVHATNEALSAESASGRWVALLDALAYAPFSQRVTPVGVPTEPSDELKTKVAKLKNRLPNIATAFGLTNKAKSVPPAPTPASAPAPGSAPAPAPAEAAPTATDSVDEPAQPAEPTNTGPAPEAPAPEAPAPEVSAPEAPTPESAPADSSIAPVPPTE